APSERFTGDVYVDSINPRREGSKMIVSCVHFIPCARTDWHSHALGQTLHITEGVALLGTRDGEVIVAHPGDTIYTPPDQEHWHGATPTDFMSHLAMLEGADDGTDGTAWLEKVTDDQYNTAAAAIEQIA
ncbi:MAG: (R)-mandelonitrile lyase, partial [Streptosporangiaceae bacterium]